MKIKNYLLIGNRSIMNFLVLFSYNSLSFSVKFSIPIFFKLRQYTTTRIVLNFTLRKTVLLMGLSIVRTPRIYSRRFNAKHIFVLFYGLIVIFVCIIDQCSSFTLCVKFRTVAESLPMSRTMGSSARNFWIACSSIVELYPKKKKKNLETMEFLISLDDHEYAWYASMY